LNRRQRTAKKNMNTLEMAAWLARIGTRSILTLAVVALLFQGCAVSRRDAVPAGLTDAANVPPGGTTWR
jgi:hypothetical protein